MSEDGKKTIRSFGDWVNANSAEIPPEIDYARGGDPKGPGVHGHDEHGHEGAHSHEEDHGHEEVHGHEEDHGHEAHGHEAHGGHEHAHFEPHEIVMPKRERRVRVKRGKMPRTAVEEWYRVFAILSGLLLAAILLLTVIRLPRFGSTDAPAVNEVSRRYLEEGLTDTGAVNAVAGIILDYRAFDTLGESVVLFTASVTVIFLLQQAKRKQGEEKTADEIDVNAGVRSLPAKVIIKITFPFIVLYGIYVVLNGHLSPGGGFSGGTILGGALILSHSVFGERYTGRFINVGRCTQIMAAGLFVYIALKTYSILTGANGIASAIPLGTPGSIFSAGLILPLNICVGLIVSCTIYALYNLFTGWRS
ncbi:MAG: hypothetical protein IJQ21_10360 [Lachnospiraceae bacterium]|nr:hypothetical protein [Lachnospiraceae bacterium]